MLVQAVRQLARSRTATDVQRVLGVSVRRIARADGASLTVREGDICRYVQEDGMSPGWSGRSMPLASCLSGVSMIERRSITVPDVHAERTLPLSPYHGTAVRSLAVVPVLAEDPVGAVTVYWLRPHLPGKEELAVLVALADSASLALANVALGAELEARVLERTAQLEERNARLENEVAARRRTEDEIRQLSLVDELTGLYNRRGFMLLAGRELESLRRSGRRGLALYMDLDGLKQANDTRGHEAGDRLIQRAAGVLRSSSRESDVTARLGGDEFAVFMTLGYDHPPVHLIVERFLEAARRVGISWSVGATATPPGRVVTLEDLLAGADEAMYRGRRARRGSKEPAVAAYRA